MNVILKAITVSVDDKSTDNMMNLVVNDIDLEQHIEDCARTSYNSKRKTKDTTHKFLEGVVKAGHMSVVEHGSVTFEISGVSRALSHQLVRHRHVSFTQQSQRYVDMRDFEFITPPSISMNPKALEEYNRVMGVLETAYDNLRALQIPKEDARFVLPNACGTLLIASSNMSGWHHYLTLRCAPDAQWEIRMMSLVILRKLYRLCPAIFSDLAQKYLGV